MKIRQTLIASMIVLASVATASPAVAAAPVVVIDARISGTWPVWSGAQLVDRYTGSRFVYRACRASDRRCVIIRERVIHSYWAAVTYPSYTRPVIYLNPQRRGYSWYTKRSMVTHELGHAMGITWHAVACTNLMYSRVFCSNGHVPPYRFSDPQIRRLRAN